MNNLPPEIICNICNYSNLNDIYALKFTNKYMYNTITSSHYVLFKNEMKKFSCIAENDIYDYLNKMCRSIMYEKPCKYLKKNTIHSISDNCIVNNIFKNIIIFFIYHGYIELYPNKLELLLCYIFIQIVHEDVRELDYIVKFIKLLTKDHFYDTYDDIIKQYYITVIKSLNYEKSFHYLNEINNTESFGDKYIHHTTLENLYNISQWVITPHVIKKLCGYKPLDLSKSVFLSCCTLCCKKPVHTFVFLKYNHRNDQVIGHNYQCFKQMLKTQASYSSYYYFNLYERPLNELNFLNSHEKYNLPLYIYDIILNQEKKLVSKYISAIDPVTNEKISYSKIKKRINNRNIPYRSVTTYDKIIKKQEKHLIKQIFDN